MGKTESRIRNMSHYKKAIFALVVVFIVVCVGVAIGFWVGSNSEKSNNSVDDTDGQSNNQNISEKITDYLMASENITL